VFVPTVSVLHSHDGIVPVVGRHLHGVGSKIVELALALGHRRLHVDEHRHIGDNATAEMAVTTQAASAPGILPMSRLRLNTSTNPARVSRRRRRATSLDSGLLGRGVVAG
jgi:hypothetical protein